MRATMEAAAAGPKSAIRPKSSETLSSSPRVIENTYANTTYALSG